MAAININLILSLYRKISILLLYLLPISLISGPFLSDLSISLIGLFFLIFSIKNRLWQYYKNLFVLNFSIFYLYLILRSLFSADIFYSLEGCLFYFRYLFFSLGIFYLINYNPILVRNLGLSIFFTLVVVLLDSYLQWITGYNIFGWSVENRLDRLSGFFGEELILGGYLARLTPIMLALLIYSYKPTKIKTSIMMFFLALIAILIFGTGERAAFFFIILFLFMLLFLSNLHKLKSLIVLIITSISIFFISTYDPISNLKIKNTFKETTSNIFTNFAPYTPLHEEHYIVALNIFSDNVIFGKGPNMFDVLCLEEKYYYSANACTNHPHNIYIQLLAETGIIGFLFLFLVFILVCFSLLKQFYYLLMSTKNNLPEYLIIFLLSIFIMTWPLIPTGSFFNNWTNVMYYLPVGFILHFLYNKKI